MPRNARPDSTVRQPPDSGNPLVRLEMSIVRLACSAMGKSVAPKEEMMQQQKQEVQPSEGPVPQTRKVDKIMGGSKDVPNKPLSAQSSGAKQAAMLQVENESLKKQIYGTDAKAREKEQEAERMARDLESMKQRLEEAQKEMDQMKQQIAQRPPGSPGASEKQAREALAFKNEAETNRRHLVREQQARHVAEEESRDLSRKNRELTQQLADAEAAVQAKDVEVQQVQEMAAQSAKDGGAGDQARLAALQDEVAALSGRADNASRDAASWRQKAENAENQLREAAAWQQKAEAAENQLREAGALRQQAEAAESQLRSMQDQVRAAQQDAQKAQSASSQLQQQQSERIEQQAARIEVMQKQLEEAERRRNEPGEATDTAARARETEQELAVAKEQVRELSGRLRTAELDLTARVDELQAAKANLQQANLQSQQLVQKNQDLTLQLDAIQAREASTPPRTAQNPVVQPSAPLPARAQLRTAGGGAVQAAAPRRSTDRRPIQSGARLGGSTSAAPGAPRTRDGLGGSAGTSGVPGARRPSGASVTGAQPVRPSTTSVRPAKAAGGVQLQPRR
mmetsp:Transcript_83632/g.190870  ORF Transcript_83632/g.190870 Transcript_83632/m.190870 type:complete len:568 (-) Transcript_83632:127-1830(-)